MRDDSEHVLLSCTGKNVASVLGGPSLNRSFVHFIPCTLSLDPSISMLH